MKNNLLIAGTLGLVMALTATTESHAQRRRNTGFMPYSEVGMGVGTSSYYGELAGYRKPIRSTFLMMRWNAGAMYTRHFTPNLSARASFTWARIAGDDYTYNKGNVAAGPAQFARNLHFRNDLKEFGLTGIYQFVKAGKNTNYRPKLTPYVFAGLALTAHSPEAKTPVDNPNPGVPDDTQQRWVKLQPLGTEGQGQPGNPEPYPLVVLAVPVGFGVRYKLNDRFDVGAELGFRITRTDYLDDVGGPYPADPNLVTSEVGRALSDRRTEATAARKGGDRVQLLQDYLTSQGIQGDPLQIVRTDPNFAVRGAKGILNDGYLIGQIQLHYVLLPRIKCPPIK